MDIRIAGIATVAAAVLVADCGDKSAPPAASTSGAAATSAAAPTPKASDEDQIREPAYKTAMLDVVKQSMSIHLVLVDNIVVKGDAATADVTLTQRLGQHPPDTKTTPATLVRMDGKWLDCTPPAQP